MYISGLTNLWMLCFLFLDLYASVFTDIILNQYFGPIVFEAALECVG